MRISDWSSDVCSSDLFARPLTDVDYVLAKVGAMASILFAFSYLPQVVLFVGQMLVSEDGALRYLRDNAEILWQVPVAVRSEERRVGKEWVSQCSSRWSH